MNVEGEQGRTSKRRGDEHGTKQIDNGELTAGKVTWEYDKLSVV